MKIQELKKHIKEPINYKFHKAGNEVIAQGILTAVRHKVAVLEDIYYRENFETKGPFVARFAGDRLNLLFLP